MDTVSHLRPRLLHVHRQLTEELHLEKEERVRLLQMEADYRHEMTQLKAVNDRQQRPIKQSRTQARPVQHEAIMQLEITRLTEENLVRGRAHGLGRGTVVEFVDLEQSLKMLCELQSCGVDPT